MSCAADVLHMADVQSISVPSPINETTFANTVVCQVRVYLSEAPLQLFHQTENTLLV